MSTPKQQEKRGVGAITEYTKFIAETNPYQIQAKLFTYAISLNPYSTPSSTWLQNKGGNRSTRPVLKWKSQEGLCVFKQLTMYPDDPCHLNTQFILFLILATERSTKRQKSRLSSLVLSIFLFFLLPFTKYHAFRSYGWQGQPSSIFPTVPEPLSYV